MTHSNKAKPHYIHPPIMEAVCEIHFADERRTEEQLLQIVPTWIEKYPNQQIVEEQSMQVEIGMLGATVKQAKLGKKLICKSLDGTRLVQLTGQMLAVNQLRPYMGWKEGFRDIILARWAEIQRELGVSAVRTIALRYINRIEIKQSPLRWDEWFNYPIPFPNVGGQPITNFQMGCCQALSETVKFTVNVTNAQNPEPDFTWVILDITVIMEDSFPGDDLEQRLEMIHGPHSDAFELYIRDTLRSQFVNSAQS